MKNKILLNTFLISLLTISKIAVAEISYAAKFLNTTAVGCSVGLGSGVLFGEYGRYDVKTKQVVTWIGATTGCLSAAIFSYFFYDDPSKDLAQHNEQLQHLNNHLQLQLQVQVNNEKLQSQNFLTNNKTINSILENMQIAKIDFEKIGGLDNLKIGLKKCDVIYPLWMGKNGFVHSNIHQIKVEESWIPVSPHFALKAWQFYYSKDGCFEEDKEYGYFENVMPGLSNQLENQLRYTLTIKQKNK